MGSLNKGNIGIRFTLLTWSMAVLTLKINQMVQQLSLFYRFLYQRFYCSSAINLISELFMCKIITNEQGNLPIHSSRPSPNL